MPNGPAPEYDYRLLHPFEAAFPEESPVVEPENPFLYHAFERRGWDEPFSNGVMGVGLDHPFDEVKASWKPHRYHAKATDYRLALAGRHFLVRMGDPAEGPRRKTSDAVWRDIWGQNRSKTTNQSEVSELETGRLDLPKAVGGASQKLTLQIITLLAEGAAGVGVSADYLMGLAPEPGEPNPRLDHRVFESAVEAAFSLKSDGETMWIVDRFIRGRRSDHRITKHLITSGRYFGENPRAVDAARIAHLLGFASFDTMLDFDRTLDWSKSGARHKMWPEGWPQVAPSPNSAVRNPGLDLE